MFSSSRCEGAVYDFWELSCKIPTCQWPFPTSHSSPQGLGRRTPHHPRCPSIRQQWWKSALCCLRDTPGQVLLLKKHLHGNKCCSTLQPKASRTRENDSSSAAPHLGIKTAMASLYYYSLHCCATDKNLIFAFEEESVDTALTAQPP